jgi:hypothetical protein
MSASACHCGNPAFADFDRCADHVPHWALLAEVVRLRARLLASNGRGREPARREDNNPPAGRRSEITILERM